MSIVTSGSGYNNVLGRVERVSQMLLDENLYRKIVENAHEIISIVKKDGCILFVNTRVKSVLGYDREELIGRHFVDFVYPEDRTKILEQYERILEGERLPPLCYLRAVDSEGNPRWLEINAFLSEFAGESTVLCFLSDITERKRLEEEKDLLSRQLLHAQKLESLGKLAGGVAHDFNNMLTVILSYSEMLLKRFEADQQVRRYLTEMKKAAERSANLTRQLLVFSRKQALRPELLNINTVIRDLEKMLRRLIGEDIELEFLLSE